MKILLFPLMLCVSIVIYGQTQFFSSDQILTSVYTNKITVDSYYSQATELTKINEQDYYSFLSGTKEISVGPTSYKKRNELNSALVIWNSTYGTIKHVSELGDDQNIVGIAEHFIMPNGNIFIYAHANLNANNPLSIGNQIFEYRTDTLPNYISAQFNVSSQTWEHVNFYYVGRKNNDNYLNDVSHFVTSNGDIYMCGTYDAPYIIINTDTIIKKSAVSNPFFICKLDSDFKKIWSKQSVNVGVNTYINNVEYGIDGADNIYISGTLGYVTGAIEIDGVLVKNDTINDEYDYTYTDLFLYKINSNGTVELGKTYLFRGTEQLSDMQVLADGNIYMCGDYSNEFVASPVGNFPPTSGGSNYYNVFLAKVNGSTGNIIWGQPLTSNVYYQERLRNIRVDADNNIYIGSRFANAQITFMGDTYYKRTDNAYATQILFAKINSDGQKQWTKVLGSTTTFDNIIEHQLYHYWNISDTTMILMVPHMSYGSNSNIEWGDTLEPTVSIPGTIFDNMLLISTQTGDVLQYFNRGMESMVAIDSVSYFGIRNDFEYFEAYKLTTQTKTISGTVSVNGTPLINSMYTYLELISVMPGETGTIKSWATLNQSGEFTFNTVPIGGEYLISVTPYDSTIMCGYYSQQGYAEWHQADTVRSAEQNNGIEIQLQKIIYPTGGGTIRGTIVIDSLTKASISSIANVQVVLRTQQKSTDIVAFTRAYYDYMNLTDSYSYEFKNIPAGDYVIEVLYPFATAAETIPISITEENQVFEQQDFKVINDRVYKRFMTDIETVLQHSNNKVVYNSQKDAIDITYSNKNTPFLIHVYSVQGAHITSITSTESCSISLQDKASGVYMVQVDKEWFKIIK
ncbi:MAG TPA: carboxypeptidase-like regulatory domain-containing protein [Bacteroidales bacterium]|nr:carboxypeptidase-like regulatory domain-containing protein [Bacteroidales bacterium]